MSWVRRLRIRRRHSVAAGGGGEPVRRSSLQTCPKEVPLHVHFPPESILTSVTMIPPPPDKGGPVRALRKAICGCLCLCRRQRGGTEAAEEEVVVTPVADKDAAEQEDTPPTPSSAS